MIIYETYTKERPFERIYDSTDSRFFKQQKTEQGDIVFESRKIALISAIRKVFTAVLKCNHITGLFTAKTLFYRVP